MKLVVGSIIAAGLAAHAASPGKGLLMSMEGASDECEGCENAPEVPTVCPNPPCNDAVCGKMPIYEDECDGTRCKVDCSLERGYYPDNSHCRGYCFCAGKDAVDEGTGYRVPSRWEMCPEGTVWEPNCFGFFTELRNGMGYEGGCCAHPARVLNFVNCPGGCERLSKYHCKKSNTCAWNNECNCCKPDIPVDPKPDPRPECISVEQDVTFVIDGSGSIGKMWFDRSKMFIKRLSARIDFNTSRVAIVQYSTGPQVELAYSSSFDEVMATLSAMPYIGKSTKTGVALKFTQDNVIPHKRPGVPSVVFVLTDGVSYDDGANDVAIRGPELQHQSVVFGMGVAKADEAQLNHIATDANEDHVFLIREWEEAFQPEVIEAVTLKICTSVLVAPANDCVCEGDVCTCEPLAIE